MQDGGLYRAPAANSGTATRQAFPHLAAPPYGGEYCLALFSPHWPGNVAATTAVRACGPNTVMLCGLIVGRALPCVAHSDAGPGYSGPHARRFWPLLRVHVAGSAL